MGDLLGNPRVAPPPFCVSRACSFGGAGWFPHLAAPILGVAAKAPKRAPEQNSVVKRALARVVLGWVTSWEILVLHLLLFASVGLVLLVGQPGFPTRRLRSLALLQKLRKGPGTGWFPQPAAPILGVAAKAPKRAPEQNSVVKRALARVVLGWVTSWEILVLHLLLFASVRLVLLVGQASFLTRRLRSLALLQKLRKGPRNSRACSFGGAGWFPHPAAPILGVAAKAPKRAPEQNSVVKRALARVVLGWVTSWEILVLHLLLFASVRLVLLVGQASFLTRRLRSLALLQKLRKGPRNRLVSSPGGSDPWRCCKSSEKGPGTVGLVLLVGQAGFLTRRLRSLALLQKLRKGPRNRLVSPPGGSDPWRCCKSSEKDPEQVSGLEDDLNRASPGWFPHPAAPILGVVAKALKRAPEQAGFLTRRLRSLALLQKLRKGPRNRLVSSPGGSDPWRCRESSEKGPGTVKRALARVVLGWVTSWEVLVLHLLLFASVGLVLLVGQAGFLTRRLRSLALLQKLRKGPRNRLVSSPGGSDPWRCCKSSETGPGTGAIIPALMHRIPSELCSEACSGESSTGMGDLLGNPRVAPPPFCVSRACSFGGAGWFPHPAAPILGVAAKAPKRAPEQSGLFFWWGRLVSSPGGSDPWRCRESSEKGPGTVKRALARVVLGWVTSWEVLVLHLLLFASVGLVLLVGQAGFLTRRLRSLALLQKLRKGPRNRLVSSPGGSDPWRCCKSSETGPGTGAIIPALMHRIPSELCSEACSGESSTGMGDLLGNPRVAPPPFCVSRACSFGGAGWFPHPAAPILGVAAKAPKRAPEQAGLLTQRLRSLALLQKLRKGPRNRLVSSPGGSDPWRCCKSSETGPGTGWSPHPAAPILGVAAKAPKRAPEQSSTGMGDLLGSPRVAPPPFCVSRACSFGGAGWFRHPAAPILGVAAKAPKRAPEQVPSYQHQCIGSHQNSVVKRALARVVLGWVTSWEILVLHLLLFVVSRACSFGWFPHPAAPILGVAAKAPKRAPEQNSVVKRALARVVLGWVTSWEVLVLHLLLFASVGLVLLVGQAGFLTRRLRSLALLQKLRKGPRNRLVSSPGGSDPWRCCKSSETGPGTGAIIPALMHRIPSELCSEACSGESSTGMGDLLGNPRVAPPPFCVSRACSFGGAGWFPHPAAPILGVAAKAPKRAPEQAGLLTQRLRSLALLQKLRKGPRNRLVSSPGGSDPWRCCKSSETGPGTGWSPHPAAPILGVAAKAPKRAPEQSSTGMGDLLGSPRVAPPPFCVSRACSFGGAGWFRHPAAPILGVAAKAPKRAPEQVPSYQHQCIGSHQNSVVKRALARVVLGWVTSWEILVLHLLLFVVSRACSFGWFPHPAAPILGVAAKAPKRAPEQVPSYQHQCIGSHQNSVVKRALARVVLGWVTSWEILVLHLLLFASVGLVLLAGFLTRRLRSLALLQKLRKGPRNRLVSSPGGTDPWRCRESSEKGPGTVKRALARVVLGWVTSWEVLVLHLLLFASVGLVLLVGQAGFLTRRLRSLALLQKLRKGPRNRLVSSPGGSDPWRCCKSSEMGPGTVKRALARVVLGWVTSLEVLVLHLLLFASVGLVLLVPSYQHQCIGSHQNSVVKRALARVVLGWVTSWEILVLHLLLFVVSRACSFGWFPHPAAPILGVAAKAPKRAPEQVPSYQHQCIGSHQNSVVKRALARVVLGWVTSWEILVLHLLLFASVGLVLLAGFLTRRLRSLALLQKLRKGPRNRLVSSPGGTDPWRCRESSEKGPGTVKRALARVVLGWVTSWEVLVLHLLLFASVGLVLLVGQAGFLTRRLRSLALLQKLRKGPRNSRACSFGGAGWFPHPAAPILGVAAKAPKWAPEQNSIVKLALARVVLGWVTSWEILVLHLLLFASVELVLLSRKVSAAQAGPGQRQSSTGMGDLLRNPRVAPPPFCVSRACSFGGAGWFPHPAAPILGVAAKAPKRTPEQSSTGMGDLLGNPRVAPPPFCVSRACSFGGAGWFPHPAAPILGVAAKAPKWTPEQVSGVEDDLNRASPGWDGGGLRTSFPAAPPGPRD
ncbi:hypothetical protein VNO77_08294 [Canavalia gladiata]|uniref:Uncharacterized protein n=1 Tax=Canavalia gladiata TaxID=3824 RepID=A0AAN9MC50_CANGL